jgi:DNA polymerase
MIITSVDFETFYDKSKKIGYSVKSMGDYPYFHDPRFNAYMISVSDGADTWAGELRDFNWNSIDGADTLLSHNAQFDAGVYRRLVALGLAPQIKFSRWLCTANMSSYLCNRRSLADAAEFLLGIKVDKDIRDRASGKTVEQMKSEGWWAEMLRYARRDAFTCQQLFMKHGHRWPEFERRLSEQTINQGDRGIQTDIEKLNEYIKVAHTMLKDTEATLPWIAEGAAPTSPKAIAEHCRLHGIPSPPVKVHEGEEAFIEWENTYGPKHTWIASVSNRRSINKFLDSLETIKARLTPEGILNFRLKYFGAHTGRWSGDGGVNMQNLRKEPLYRDDKGFLISDIARLKEIERSKTPPGYVTAYLDLRSIFIPRAGKKMIVSDLSQVEPRILAWVTGNQKMLDLMASGQSPYEAHARTALGWAGGKLKDENKEMYSLAKAQVLGLGYQCAWQKFITVAWNMAAYDVTKDDPEWVPALNEEGNPLLNKDGNPLMEPGYGFNSKRIVKEFRAQNPLTTGLWKRLDEAFKASVQDGEFRMELPSGRVMTYRKVAREFVPYFDEEEKRYKRKPCVTAEAVKMGRLCRVPLYGGLLTENLVQAIARDVFGRHLLALDETFGSGTVLWSAHDEAICEVDPSITAKDVEKVMSVAPEWLAGCPIAAEAQEVKAYKK